MTRLNNQIGNNKLSNEILGSNQDGYALTWDETNGTWQSIPKIHTYNYDVTNSNSGENIVIIRDPDPIMNINFITDPDTFNGALVFPQGKPFVAIVAANSSFNVYLASEVGTGASVIFPLDGYTSANGFITISGIDASAGIYDSSTNPTGIYYVILANSTGLDGYVGGFPLYGINNNGFYRTYSGSPGYTASAPTSTYVDIYSPIQASLNIDGYSAPLDPNNGNLDWATLDVNYSPLTVNLSTTATLIISDGHNLYSTNYQPTAIPIPSGTYNIQDPTGTTYYLNAGYSAGTVTIRLPSNPPDGTEFTFTDPYGQLSNVYTTELDINAMGSSILTDSNSNTGQVFVETLTIQGAYSIVSLKYVSSLSYWIITRFENNPYSISTIGGGSTFSQVTHDPDQFFIDTNGGIVTFNTYFFPYPGQTLTFKDSTGSWGSNNFVLNSSSGSYAFENPVRASGSVNPGPGTYASSLTFKTTGNCIKFVMGPVHDGYAGIWLVESQLLPEP